MSNWDGKSKGSLLGYKIFLLTIKYLGVGFVYKSILPLVTVYYYRFSSQKREPIVNFYQSALSYNREKALKTAKKNFYVFGQTLVDRTAFLIGKNKQFTHTFENEELLVDLNKSGKGGILISGHVGNWETAGNLLVNRVSSKMNVIMYDEEVQEIKKYMDEKTGGSKFNIIAIKDDFSHIIKIHNALAENEFIAVHADRTKDGAKFIEIDFFGRPAKFPLGPFLIASKFGAPVTFVFAVKKEKFHYHLSATPVIYEKKSPEDIARLYVQELEKKVKLHPEQWFNYFEFYD